MNAMGLLRHITRWVIARANISSERGATAVEYGIMVMLIAAVILVATVFLGQRTSNTFSCTARGVSLKSSVAGC